MIEAVIFDMDGLMVNTESLIYKAFATVLSNLGVTYTPEDNKKYLGMSDADEASDIIQTYNLTLSVEELLRRKSESYKKLLPEVKPQPGLLELLNYLQKKGYKKAVASSSQLEEIQTIARNLKIESFFNGYFSSEQVESGKPAPDLFLFAAMNMGILPNRCLVLEDTARGIEAAFRAGMMSYAIPSTETRGMDFGRASRLLNSLLDVPKYLKQDRMK